MCIKRTPFSRQIKKEQGATKTRLPHTAAHFKIKR